MEIMDPILLEKDRRVQEEKIRDFYDVSNKFYIQNGGITSSERDTYQIDRQNKESIINNNNLSQTVELNNKLI